MPDDTPDHMAQAWVDCLRWAIENEEVLSEFHAATEGRWKMPPARCALEAMIDDATGAAEAFIDAFVTWFNANVWGPMA